MDSKNIVDHFGDLPDPREDNRRHVLMDIIVIVICASMRRRSTSGFFRGSRRLTRTARESR